MRIAQMEYSFCYKTVCNLYRETTAIKGFAEAANDHFVNHWRHAKATKLFAMGQELYEALLASHSCTFGL